MSTKTNAQTTKQHDLLLSVLKRMNDLESHPEESPKRR